MLHMQHLAWETWISMSEQHYQTLVKHTFKRREVQMSTSCLQRCLLSRNQLNGNEDGNYEVHKLD